MMVYVLERVTLNNVQFYICSENINAVIEGHVLKKIIRLTL